MSKGALMGLALVIAAAGGVVAQQMPELQRYRKVRKM